MDTIGSISSDLPKRGPIKEELAELDASTVAEFKAAATAVTKLYTLAGTKSRLSKTQGYLECLEDLVQYITTVNGDAPVSTENVLNWALNKQHALTVNSSEPSTPTSKPTSTSSVPNSTILNPSENSGRQYIKDQQKELLQPQHQQKDLQNETPKESANERFTLRALVSAQKSQSQAKSSSQFSFATPPLIPQSDSMSDHSNDEGLTSYYGSMFSYNSDSNSNSNSRKSSKEMIDARESEQKNRASSGNEPKSRTISRNDSITAHHTHTTHNSHNTHNPIISHNTHAGHKKNMDFGNDSDSGESDFEVLDDMKSKKRYRRSRKTKIGTMTSVDNHTNTLNTNNMNNFYNHHNHNHPLHHPHLHHHHQRHSDYQKYPEYSEYNPNFNQTYNRGYGQGVKDDRMSAESSPERLDLEDDKNGSIPVSAFYYNSGVVEPKRQRFV